MDRPESRSRNLLACLGDPSRFHLVLSLLQADRCVTELAGEVGLSQSCTTRHLQFLEREGIVIGVRQGKRVVFRLRSDRPRVRELLAWVTATTPGGRTAGADIHHDGEEAPEPAAGRGGKGRAGMAGPGERMRPPQRRRPSPRAPVRPAGPGSDRPSEAPAAGVAAAQADPPAADAPAASGTGDTPAEQAVPAARTDDMEDWLL